MISCYSSAAPTNTNIRGSGEGPSRNMYKTGETAIMRCYGSSATPVTYRWTFSGGPLPANAQQISAVLRLVLRPMIHTDWLTLKATL